MTRVEWTPEALADIEAIKEYIARSSVQYAALMALRLVQSVERLEQFPDSGRMVPEFGRADLREVLEGRYRVVDRRLATKVEVLAVWHGARLLKLDP